MVCPDFVDTHLLFGFFFKKLYRHNIDFVCSGADPEGVGWWGGGGEMVR